MKSLKSVSLMLLTTLLMNVSFAQNDQKTVEVGGAEMYPSKNIIENAMNSQDHTTLVAAVKAAGLVETLQGKGPFTVFAPTNSAFGMLPAGTVESLVKPENKSALTSILTYHVVAGKLDSKELEKWIKKGNGSAELTTVAGGKIWIMKKDGKWSIKDEKGGMATITIPNASKLPLIMRAGVTLPPRRDNRLPASKSAGTNTTAVTPLEIPRLRHSTQ